MGTNGEFDDYLKKDDATPTVGNVGRSGPAAAAPGDADRTTQKRIDARTIWDKIAGVPSPDEEVKLREEAKKEMERRAVEIRALQESGQSFAFSGSKGSNLNPDAETPDLTSGSTDPSFVNKGPKNGMMG